MKTTVKPESKTVIVHYFASTGAFHTNGLIRTRKTSDHAALARRDAMARLGPNLKEFRLVSCPMIPTRAQLRQLPLR